MESTIVIKVKYGETLRRFYARINEAGNLELSLNGLLEKVLSLLSLAPETDLTLTYLDEDGDSVTLADDEDLSDAMCQSLNPLRITVKVNSEKDGISSNTRSSGNSTPTRSSPRVSQPLPDFSSTVSKILKDVPEPIGEALTKISLDLASKATASSSQLPELVQQFSKMLQSCMIPVSDLQACKISGTQSAGAESSTPSLIAKEPEASGGDGVKPKVADIPNSANRPFRYEKKVDSMFVPPGKNTFIAPEPTSLNADADLFGNGKVVSKKSGESSLNAEAVKPARGNIKAVAASVMETDNKKVMKPCRGWNSLGEGASSVDPNTFWSRNSAFKTVNPGGSTSAGSFNQKVAGQCPFSGIPVENDLSVPDTRFAPRVHPFNRNLSWRGAAAGIFHRGVRCDGCGVHPITGPRFKSKVKEDFDLCSICFAEIGSEAEYIRYDHPVPYRHPHPFKNAGVNPRTLLQSCVVNPNRPKLDSRFITDVNVIDGTMMAPLTPFTKIWRMRNNGTLVWPEGTQIVWIGGDGLSSKLSAGLQIPKDGLAVENELDIAVDFTAPELPGRYVSYWRMASPSGQKFGQRIWVLIQVEASVKGSERNDNWPGLNLNLPPESNASESIPINVEPIAVDGRLPVPEPFNRPTDLVEPLVVPLPTEDQDFDFPINDTLLVSSTTAYLDGGHTTVSYPTVNSSALLPVVASLSPPTPPAVVESSTGASGEQDGVEQVLLLELEEMGFNQVNLNKEILRMNDFNLEQSVDALCGVSEWDPLLEELQEMGFCDREINKKLLKKNNGSIKGAVMDLITEEKA